MLNKISVIKECHYHKALLIGGAHISVHGHFTFLTVIVLLKCKFCVITTIFNTTGVSDPPVITLVSLVDNSFRSSWYYVRIPTVDVTLYWNLSLFRPNQSSNMTNTLLNTNIQLYLTRNEAM